MMEKIVKEWKKHVFAVALVACVGLLAGCPVGGPVSQTIEGEIVSVDAEAQTFVVSTTAGEVTLSYADIDIFLPGDTDTASGTAADLAAGVDVTVAATAATNGTITATRITVVAPTGGGGGGGGGGGTHTDIGEGALIIPTNDLALTIDGGPLSRNGDLYTGSIDWYSFNGVAGTKYNILTRGNAPVVVSVYKAVQIGTQTAASMLWTTDPAENITVLFVENPVAKTSASAQAAWIPSFVAPSDGEYFISVQAAIVTVCSDCGETVTSEGYTIGGEPHVITYHDVRSYSVEVNSVSDSSSAIELTAGDPTTDPTFVMGAVTISQGDWFYFDGDADQNYQIEFRPTNRTGDDSIFARIYAPSGSIACQAIACTECKATPFYSPVAVRYLVNITLEGDWTNDNVEWGQAEYMIRILEDDHGNDAALSTPVTLVAGAGASTATGGFLSSMDTDAFMFEMSPWRTYRVATSSNPDALIRVDVDLEDFAFSPNGPWDRNNVDGIGNESALFQNDSAWPEYAVAGVSPAEANDAFGLRMGEFILTIFNDDHADIGAQTFDASPVAIGTQATGVLWGDVDRDNNAGSAPAVADVNDSDLFAFTPALAPAWHRVTESGATMLTVDGNATVQDDPTTIAIETRDHYESENTTDPVRVHIEGPNAHQLGTAYTLDVTQEDHANLSTDAELNEDNAVALTSGTPVAGVLWGEPEDDDIFQFSALPNRTYKVSITGAGGSTALSTSITDVDNYDITVPENNRAIAVTNGGADPVAAIVQVSLGEATDSDFGYNVQVDADDYVDSAVTADEITALTDIGTNAASGVLFKTDTDAFRFAGLANRTYKVTVNGASAPTSTTFAGAAAVTAHPNADPDDNVRTYSVSVGGTAQTVVSSVAYEGPAMGDDADTTYTISVVADDHVDTANLADAQSLMGVSILGPQAVAGSLFVGDVDTFLYTAATGGGTVYTFTPVNANITIVVDGVQQADNTYTHNGADGAQVLVQIIRSVDAPETGDVAYSLTVN